MRFLWLKVFLLVREKKREKKTKGPELGLSLAADLADASPSKQFCREGA